MTDIKNCRQESGRRFVPAILLSVLLLFTCIVAVGCQSTGSNTGKEDTGKLKVVTTLFPYYDFLRQIAGDNIELVMVVPAGMDSHSFEPTPADMITMEEADLLICNGGTMELWLSKVLDSMGEAEKPGRVVTMMDYVDTVEEEIMEGMEAEEHDHDHEEDGHAEEIEYDEHIWTSPVNAMRLTEVLAEVLCEESPQNADIYRKNKEAYVEELKALDRELRTITESGERRLLIFGDKFPFRYFFDEYDLEYRAAFSGCSTDTEPSARTIAYLIDKVKERQIPAIYYLELSSHRVAEIIGEETKAEPLLFHSCHNVTRKEFDSGITYLELMERNARNLRKGLN